MKVKKNKNKRRRTGDSESSNGSGIELPEIKPQNIVRFSLGQKKEIINEKQNFLVDDKNAVQQQEMLQEPEIFPAIEDSKRPEKHVSFYDDKIDGRLDGDGSNPAFISIRLTTKKNI